MSFYTDVLRKDPRFGTLQVVNDLALLQPGFRAKVEALIADASSQGVTLHVLETYRSQARQHYLFTKGATKLSHVGCHGYGVAVDLGLMTPHGVDPNGSHYEALRLLCTKHKAIWGGDWGLPAEAHSFRDYDHCQGVPLFRQNEMFAGSWYPADDYDPWADMRAHNID
jgi:hypothetical protein